LRRCRQRHQGVRQGRVTFFFAYQFKSSFFCLCDDTQKEYESWFYFWRRRGHDRSLCLGVFPGLCTRAIAKCSQKLERFPARSGKKKWEPKPVGGTDPRMRPAFLLCAPFSLVLQVIAEGQKVVCEIYPHRRRGLEARNVRLEGDPTTVVKPHGMPMKEYQEILARRAYDEELVKIFDSGFWRYPKSEETVEVEKVAAKTPNPKP
jgi:hypothetical protein